MKILTSSTSTFSHVEGIIIVISSKNALFLVAVYRYFEDLLKSSCKTVFKESIKSFVKSPITLRIVLNNHI